MTTSAAAPGLNVSAVRKVQVGCGPTALLDGWCNTDLRPFPGLDLAMDATKPWPFHGLTHVFAEHFIEHLAIDQAIDFLVAAGTALAPGGRMRLSTPNVEWVVATQYALQRDGTEEERLDGVLSLNRAFHGWGHQFLWSQAMLALVLDAVGFEELEAFAYGESNDPEFRGIERHGNVDEYDGHLSIVIVEAVRGSRPIVPDARLTAWVEHQLLRHVRSGH
jgi:predicted SAM-dependent methyltransferase